MTRFLGGLMIAIGGLLTVHSAPAAAQLITPNAQPMPHPHQHAAATSAPAPTAKLAAAQAPGTPPCGVNFVTAMNMVNAAMRAGQNLPADAKVSRAEIDSILSMAVAMAHRDAPCVRAQLKGPVGFGYDASYSKMLMNASRYAQSRALAPAVALQAREASTLLAR